MNHTAIVKLPKRDIDKINRLLSIPSLSNLADDELREMGGFTDAIEGVFSVRFDDGSTLNYDLCSGQENYFDDVIWTSADGSRDVLLECTFELDDIEFDVDGETYEVKVLCA